MANEPSRSDLERFLVGQYAAMGRRKKETNAAGLLNLMEAQRIAHATTLFYMRTGMLASAWVEEFRVFRVGLDEEAARIDNG
jgi:hypothetical protein